MQLITISDEAKKCLENLEPAYQKVSEMSLSEREFLTELILRYKPKKVLEVGVAAGSSSVIMLNALKHVADDFEFHSADYSIQHHTDNDKKTGYVVDEYPDLAVKRNFYAGGFVSNFLDEIGSDINLCFIDTTHNMPGEILDFLLIFPYLSNNCIVVLHDTNLHMVRKLNSGNVTNLLISAISGEKLIPETYSYIFSAEDSNKFKSFFFPNITAVILDKSQREKIWDIFNILTQPWMYNLKQNEPAYLKAQINRHYGADFANFFEKLSNHQHFTKREREREGEREREKQIEQMQKVELDEQRRRVEVNNMLALYVKIKLFRYRVLSEISFGDTRKRYKRKKNYYKKLYQKVIV